MNRPFATLRHAVLMFRRNIQSYLLLSVTIVLSFSLLLGYLGYTDASLYNKYRNIFSMRRGDVVIFDLNDPQRIFRLKELLEKEEGTSCYYYGNDVGGSTTAHFTIESPGYPEGNQFYFDNCQIFYIPDHAWMDNNMVTFPNDIQWLDGQRETFFLREDEAIINEWTYYALGLEKLEAPVYTLRMEYGSFQFKIAGIARDQYPVTFDSDGYNIYRSVNTLKLILPTKLLDEATLKRCDHALVIHSTNPEQVVHTAKGLNFEHINSVYEQQDEALEAIRLEKRNKAIITCALLLLLGVNLYSCFTNALNDRKFEIGIKRAIGASAFSIVRQFLYESLIVMVTNIFLSVVLVADVFILYKFLYERTPNEWGQYLKWIIYISPQSIAMFAVCAVSLTLVFSLIFAYKSTQVEIVQYLKSE